jgi:hypothetical protein
MLYEGIRTLMLNNTPLSTLVGARIYQSVLPRNYSGAIGTAAITYEMVNSRYAGVNMGAKTLQATITEIDLSVWALDYSDSAHSIDAIHNLFDLYTGTLSDGTKVLYTSVSSIPDMFESDTCFYRSSVTLTFMSI